MSDRPDDNLKLVVPVLPVRNMVRSIDYYINRLGFELAFRDDDLKPSYAGIWRDRAMLHLQWHDEAEWLRVERPSLRIFVGRVDALFDEYSRVGVFHEGTRLTDTPWGNREFAFFDPDGNGLTFAQDLSQQG